MKKKTFFLITALLLCFLATNTKVFAAERSVYQGTKSSKVYMELWEVTSENVDSLNKDFAKLLSKAKGIEKLNVPYEGKITLDFLKKLANSSEGPIYQGYAKLNIEGSNEGYVFSTTIEKSESGNFKIKGWYVDINGELTTEFEMEMSASTYDAYMQQYANLTNNNQTVSVSEGGGENSSGSSTLPDLDPAPTPIEPPSSPIEGDTGITEPEPGEGDPVIPGPTIV